MITVPLVVTIISLIFYLLGPTMKLHPHIIEATRIAFFCGLLVTLFGVIGKTVF